MNETLLTMGPQWIDPEHLLSGSGPFGHAILPVVALVVFIESGLLFPFLPGDSLLFTAGLVTNQPDPFAPLWLVLMVAPIAAFLGDQVGFFLGHKFHPYIDQRPNGKFFKREYLHQTEDYFAKHGPITVILCRFVPIVRTYAPLVAGMAGMHYKKFVFYNAIGAVLWGSGVVALGAILGEIKFVRDHIEAIFLVIIIFTIVPGLIGIIHTWVRNGRQKPPKNVH